MFSFDEMFILIIKRIDFNYLSCFSFFLSSFFVLKYAIHVASLLMIVLPILIQEAVRFSNTSTRWLHRLALVP